MPYELMNYCMYNYGYGVFTTSQVTDKKAFQIFGYNTVHATNFISLLEEVLYHVLLPRNTNE
jgi:hypothetical protein